MRRWLYLPRLFRTRERLLILGLTLVAVASLTALASRVYLRITEPRPAVGGVLREGVLDAPRFVNPLYATADTDRDLVKLVFSGLITHDANGEVIMDAAEALEVSPDGKSYTVKLRPAIRWHNDSPLTADDVVFTIRTIQDPEYKSPFQSNWQGVTVEKLGDQTVRFTLRQPYAPFIENLAIGIIPKHLWETIPREAAPLSDLNLKPLGSGPYRFKSFTRLKKGPITAYTLTYSPAYYRGGPFLRRIEFRIFDNESALISAFERKDITSLVVPLSARTPGAETAAGKVYPLHPPQIFAVFLNGNVNPALTRKAVREALSQAIDRERLISESLGGRGQVAASPLPAGSLGYREDLEKPRFDPEAAKRILGADGWKDENGDGVLERTEGRGRARKTTELDLAIATANVPELLSAAERIAETWQAIGVKTEVRSLPAKDLEASIIRPRAYPALLFGEVFGYDPDPFAFWHTSQVKDPGLNIALYSNRKVDEILEEARRTTDREKRAALYGEFQKIVSDEIGAIFLYTPTRSYIVAAEVRGVSIAPTARSEERFSQVNEWYIKTRRVLK